jgi:hypothetical protein
MRDLVHIDPDTDVITKTFRCDCDDGWVEGRPYGYDPHNGSLLCEAYRCSVCNGTGYVDVDFVPRSETDLIEEDADIFV